MRAGGGKAKGSAYEREICKALSLWLSYGDLEDCLWRSAMSGGRSTVAFAKGKRFANQAGDISAINETGMLLTNRYMVECKTYADLGFAGLPFKRGNLAKFWAEARKQGDRYGKQPMLVAKQNSYPTIVYLTLRGIRELNLLPHRVLTIPGLSLHGVLLEVFLKHASVPSKYHKPLKQGKPTK